MRLPILASIAYLRYCQADSEFQDDHVLVSESVSESAPVSEISPKTAKTNSENSDEFVILRSYQLSHCISDECFERGTLQLGKEGARIDDSRVFDEMKESHKLHKLLKKAPVSSFYTLQLTVIPENRDSEKYVLESSVPISMIKETEDLHDSLEISLGTGSSKDQNLGEIIGINYRTTKAWGLALFEHTTVRIHSGAQPPIIRLPPKKINKKPQAEQEPKFNADGTIKPQSGKSDEEEEQPTGILGYFRKYWWIFLPTLLISQFLDFGGQEPPPKKAAGGGSTGSKKSN